MKARVRTTGEVVEIDSIISNAGFEFEDSSVERMIMEVNTLWEQRRWELVKAAMQGLAIMRDWKNEQYVAESAVKYADAVLAEYRKENV